MATLKDVPNNTTRQYAARVLLGKPDHSLREVVKAAKAQLNLANITDFSGSLSRLLLVAAHDRSKVKS